MSCFIERHHLFLGVSLVMILPVRLYGDAVAPALVYHGGRLLNGNLDVGILWYGPIAMEQKQAILSFLRSLNINSIPGATNQQPPVSSWWNIVESYQTFAKTPKIKPGPRPTATPVSIPAVSKITVNVVSQVLDQNLSHGKVLIKDFIKPLVQKANGGNPKTIGLIIASKGVTVQEMCAGSCAQHGLIENQVYIAVGDPEKGCPECAWPFIPSNGKTGVTVKAPNGNVEADVIIKLLAGGLAGAVTNPYGDGFYVKAHAEHVLEATSNCPDYFATTKVLLDPISGGAFNVVGDKGTKFLLPAIWNPLNSSCWTPL